MNRLTKRIPVFVIAVGFVLAVSVAVGAVTERRVHSHQRWDYETGSFSQWDRVQAVAGDAVVVASPVRQGRYAARFTVHPGDNPPAGGERSEAVASQAQTNGYSGAEAWYGWATLFPSNFNPVPGTSWNIFTQFHETKNDDCGPPVVFEVATRKKTLVIKVRVRGGQLSATCVASGDRSWYTVPLRLNAWSDFVFHVKWSPDPSVGFVELWINGANVIRKRHLPTLYKGQGVYLKEGFYRKPYSATSVVYQDALRRGTSYSDVNPGG